jgi:hypothetical protein
MKFEIDLNDILGDENGAETLQESVRRQVVECLVKTTRQGVDATIKIEVSKAIQETLKKELTDRMPLIVSDVLTSEYATVDRYGNHGKTTTFRGELIRSINEQMVYKSASYESDKNAFTKAVDGLVLANLAEFKKEFEKLVTAKFIADAMSYATAEMSKRLGLAK